MRLDIALCAPGSALGKVTWDNPPLPRFTSWTLERTTPLLQRSPFSWAPQDWLHPIELHLVSHPREGLRVAVVAARVLPRVSEGACGRWVPAGVTLRQACRHSTWGARLGC